MNGPNGSEPGAVGTAKYTTDLLSCSNISCTTPKMVSATPKNPSADANVSRRTRSSATVRPRKNNAKAANRPKAVSVAAGAMDSVCQAGGRTLYAVLYSASRRSAAGFRRTNQAYGQGTS